MSTIDSIVVNKVSILIGFIYSIFTDEMGIKRVSKKLMKKLLTENQMKNSFKMCLGLKNRIFNDPNFIKSVIRGD